MSRFLFDLPRPGTAARDGTWRKASHAATFTEPMEYSAGLANANIATSADGKPLHTPDGKVLLLFPSKGSPGTFGKVKGKLVKAKAQSSIKSQRWHHPHEEQRTISRQARRNRLLVGWLVAGTPSESKQLEQFNVPILPRTPMPHRRKPKSSPRPPKSTLAPPSAWKPTRPPGMLAFCADIRLTLPEFKPVVIAALKPRVFSQTAPHTASAWGASSL